ncbi:hypothetical protein F4556_005400 [Kitasatospora gansuensis]|uniref:Lipoprotein n=1 Tax=Kitasatospora gansuensis TaxID=258050 RepID=A0A7W7SG52_9ACTN|nr:hypothetical protein [Kitasatospora gansuensis]MBB4949865.1 hypothetical protein [Kitasatospora gansuensis]
MSKRTLALPALVLSVLLSVSACDPTSPTARPTDHGAAAQVVAVPSDVPSDGNPPVLPAPGGTPSVTLVSPATDRAPSARPVPVAPSAVTPSAAAPSPSGTPAVVAGAADLQLTSYDQRTGTAVLAVANDRTGAPSPSASAATGAVRTGQLIASPPSAAVPQGALLAITAVEPAGAGKVRVETRPAAISELLGQTRADIRSALDPHRIQVTPKVKDLKVSYVPKPGGGDGAASAELRLDVNDSVPLPGGSKAALTGSLALDPSVVFSYQGSHGILAPEQAKVGFDLGAHADWHLTANLTGSTGPVRIPVATLTATPTVMVGVLPVVITLNLSVYAEVSADGSVSVDIGQAVDGNWAIHAEYTKAAGWHSVTDPADTTVTPVKATFTGAATVRSALVAEGSVALYGALGVKATVKPYLRAQVQGTVTITVDGSGVKPVVDGSAGLYGGIDVDGAVLVRIAVLGTPLFQKDVPFQLYHREWPITTLSATPTS